MISSDERKYIIENSLHIFANKAPRDDFNRKSLKSINTSCNPVARIVSKTVSNKPKNVANSHFDDERTPMAVLLALGARVQITGVNYEPTWGLYHGAIGGVVDIVFAEGESPNTKDLPLYVLVDFPQYRGPELVPDKPTLVPVPVHTCRCEYNCCERSYIPLTLAYGKTAHTAQGITVGPTAPGRPPNLHRMAVIDPGTKAFEGKCVGMFYTLVGRGTTIGTADDKLSSAIYFNGVNMSEHRITNLWQSAKGTPYRLVELRKAWVDTMLSNVIESGFDEEQKMIFFNGFVISK